MDYSKLFHHLHVFPDGRNHIPSSKRLVLGREKTMQQGNIVSNLEEKINLASDKEKFKPC
jgi:hypothetical protein